MRHFLIPTDFSVESLKAVHAVISVYGTEKIKITLLHLLYMPNDIGQLLIGSYRNRDREELINEEFTESCEIIKNMHQSKVESINIQISYGSTKAYVKNLLDGMDIDRIVLCPDIALGLPSKQSVKMLPILERTGYQIDNIPSTKIRKSHDNITIMNMLKGNEMKTPKTIEDYVIKK